MHMQHHRSASQHCLLIEDIEEDTSYITRSLLKARLRFATQRIWQASF